MSDKEIGKYEWGFCLDGFKEYVRSCFLPKEGN